MSDLEEDLFGKDSDDESPQQQQHQRKSPAFQQPARRIGDDEDESDEEDQPQQRQRPIGPPLHLNAELVDLPARDSIRLVRLSNILGLESQPYERSTFQASREYYEDEQGARRIKLTNKLRWREAFDEDGQPIRQSNARFVQWEDGSWQLLLGDEVLDVKELDMQQDNSFLFVRHQGVIQGQAALETKVALQPASLSSKLHTRLTAAVDKRHTKVNKVRHTATVSNPAQEKEQRAKMEEQRIRDRENLQRRQGREMRKYAQPPARVRGTAGITADYLEAVEAESDYDDDGMTASNRARKSLLSRDRLDEQAEAEAERRLGQAKRAAPAGRPRPSPAKRSRPTAVSSDEELSEQEGSDGDGNADMISDDDEVEEDAPDTEQKPKARRGVIIEDDDDD